MIEIELTKDDVSRCQLKAKEIGELNNSITKGEGNLSGVIGEYVVHRYLKDSEWKNTYDYDLIHGDKKIDVKTKRSKFKPLDGYDVAVAETSQHQECDEYIFVTVLNDASKAWIVGRMGQKEYFSLARKMERGQLDLSNGFKVKSNCYNMQIKELNEVNNET